MVPSKSVLALPRICAISIIKVIAKEHIIFGQVVIKFYEERLNWYEDDK